MGKVTRYSSSSPQGDFPTLHLVEHAMYMPRLAGFGTWNLGRHAGGRSSLSRCPNMYESLRLE